MQLFKTGVLPEAYMSTLSDGYLDTDLQKSVIFTKICSILT